MSAAIAPAHVQRHPGAAAGPGRRLDAVDGLRAVAALWVVLFHIRAFSGANLGPVDLFVRSGSTGVSLFLVLSGFCLFLPVARGTRFATGKFFMRRARRLLPAYYASLALAILITVVAAGHLGFVKYGPLALTGETLAHVTMTHSLLPSTFYALNGAYWSLGLEWQLYLTLPLLVIGARRFGLGWTVAGVVALNVVYRLGLQVAVSAHGAPASLWTTAVLPNLLPGRWAEFAFGMVAAQLYADGRLNRNWARIGLAAIPLALLSLRAVGSPLEHLLFGSVFFLLLCTVLAERSVLSRVFAWRPLAAIGVMSYSLYLVHQPIVQALDLLFRQQGLSALATFVVVLALFPVVLLSAWLLFICVERFTLRSSGSPEPNSPEWALLKPLQWRLVRGAAQGRRRPGQRWTPRPRPIVDELATPASAVPVEPSVVQQ